MIIEQYNGNEEGYFVAIENKIEAGRILYSWSENEALIINHTQVNPECKGKNVGKTLVSAVADYARQNKIKIVPLCAFAKSVFERTPELSDLL